jgi:hypothetical protein
MDGFADVAADKLAIGVSKWPRLKTKDVFLW